jgi:phosphotransferase system  glucose/maltose/N-acetylglucosamine-specific IIC component
VKGWKYKMVPILFVLGGMGWLLSVVKQLVKEEPISGANIVFACMFFMFAIVFSVAAARKSSGDSASRNSVPSSTDAGSL